MKRCLTTLQRLAQQEQHVAAASMQTAVQAQQLITTQSVQLQSAVATHEQTVRALYAAGVINVTALQQQYQQQQVLQLQLQRSAVEQSQADTAALQARTQLQAKHVQVQVYERLLARKQQAVNLQRRQRQQRQSDVLGVCAAAVRHKFE